MDIISYTLAKKHAEKITAPFGYNLNKGLLDYRISLANHSNQVVKIYCVGDSITRGEFTSDEVNKSWSGVLRGLLQTRYGNAGEGFINPYEGTLPAGANSRWTYGSGWIWTGDGFGSRYLDSNGETTTSSVTFTGTSVDVMYITVPGAGVADVQIDGAPVGTINCNVATKWGNVVSYTGLSAGSHTLTITPQTTSKVFIEGIFASTDTKGIQVNRMGISGYQASLWNKTNIKASWAQKPPHLAIIALGMNESYTSNNISITTYKSNMASLISQFQSSGASVLLLPYFKPSDAWTTRWEEFVQANYQMADQYNIGLVDLYQAWGKDYSYAQGKGLFGVNTTNDFSGASGANTAHPGDKGHNYIGKTLERYLIL